MGSYCYYNVDPTIRQDHGFQAPNTPGVKFHNLLVVSLGGKGQYEHVINNIGARDLGNLDGPLHRGVLPLTPWPADFPAAAHPLPLGRAR